MWEGELPCGLTFPGPRCEIIDICFCFLFLSAKTTNKEPGSLAHHSSSKCVHITPTNRLMLRTGFYRPEYVSKILFIFLLFVLKISTGVVIRFMGAGRGRGWCWSYYLLECPVAMIEPMAGRFCKMKPPDCRKSMIGSKRIASEYADLPILLMSSRQCFQLRSTGKRIMRGNCVV